MHQAGLDQLPVPAGLTLAAGGSRARPLAQTPPPPIALDSEAAAELLAMLDYAGVRYRSAQSPAAAFGLRVFAAGRALGRASRHAAVSFDWDHTLSNYQIFEDLPRLLRVRTRRTPPPPAQHAAPMVAVEAARPFMLELAFGAMAGYALRQGLSRLDQWRRYVPQVAVATHTWPDRLGVMGAHYMPILPLAEGLLPGDPDTYARLTAPGVRSLLHLHHFLEYAEALLDRYEAQGAHALSPAERGELLGILEDGKAHHRKPLGAWAARGWPAASLLHVEDASRVVAELARQAQAAGHADAHFVHVRQPHSRLYTDIKEWHKISLPAFWRTRATAMHGIAAHLARREWAASPFPALLEAVKARAPGSAAGARPAPWPAAGLPEGVVLTVHETPTTLGEFWNYYVEPTQRVQRRVRALRGRAGGLRQLRHALREPG